ncbi:MAG: alpha/beta hydrolase [Pseudomonadota bacterium]
MRQKQMAIKSLYLDTGRKLSGLLFCFLILGCAENRLLMPTPNYYTEEAAVLFETLPDEYASTQVELIYVTDRAPERDEEGKLRYGYNRSNSLAVGTAIVDLGGDNSWDDLVDASQTNDRTLDFEPRLVSIKEFARLPPTPFPFQIIEGVIVEDPKVVAENRASLVKLQAEARRRLALSPQKDAFIFIHGFNNSFEDATFTLAEIWHFLGREGLPIVYTWPAGYPGIFGYTYDRESSEFTVFHLKQLIKWLAAQPEIEDIHILAHSRGTDVAVSALRELIIGARGDGDGGGIREKLKIKNFVMAAPDLDTQVIGQRIAAERLTQGIDQVTIYTSPNDNAIGLAELLFASPRGRLGTFDVEDLKSSEAKQLQSNEGRVAIISFDGEQSSGHGHDYFRTNEAVSSDIILMLRYGYRPGDRERPLEDLGFNFWRVPENYPAGADN